MKSSEYRLFPPLHLAACLVACVSLSGWASNDPVDYNDFDGDRISDLGLYRYASGDWSIAQSGQPVTAQQWGWSESIPVPGDYNRDGKTDIAVHYPLSGTWYIKYSTGGKLETNWGWFETVPVPADYDGDGFTDLAVYHTATGNWYIRESSTKKLRLQNWGWFEARPVPADYDGDGRADIAVYHPAQGMWYVYLSASRQQLKQQWGWSASVPVPADYDGDGRADMAVVDPAVSDWHILQSRTKTLRRLNFNFTGTSPVAGNYNGDAYDDIAFFSPSTGLWGIYLMGINYPAVQAWGTPADVPAANWYWNLYHRVPAAGPPPPGTPPPVNPAIPADALNVSNAKLFGNHKNVKPVNARVTRRLNSADVEGGNVRLSYETLNWPDNNSGVDSNIDGRVYIFWLENGQVVGGHFEWKRPGQTSKGLKNIETGYLEGKKPPRGATVWFCLLNNVGDERTNVVQSRTPYN